MDAVFTQLLQWTIAAGPFAAIVFFVLWKLERDERKEKETALDAERREHARDYKLLSEKFLTATFETTAAVRTMGDLLRGGRNNV